MPYDESPHRPPIPPSPSTDLVPFHVLPRHEAAGQAERARRILVACALAVTAGVGGVMALIYPSSPEEDGPDPVAEQITYPSPFDFVPSAPVSVLPAPSSSFTVAGQPLPPPPPTERQVTHRPAPTGVSHTRSPAPVVDLNVGATVGLEVSGRPGFRLRHRNFVGRVDRITSSSSELDRADSRFIVRKGLGRDTCVSLESVNYPGYFLRHRDFILRLEQPSRRDRSGLFVQDATFCTAPTQDGTAVVLESINYPSYALTLHDDDVIHLDHGPGTPFLVRSAL